VTDLKLTFLRPISLQANISAAWRMSWAMANRCGQACFGPGVVYRGQLLPDRFGQPGEGLPGQLRLAIIAVVHEAAHDLVHRHHPAHGLLADAAAAGAVVALGLQGVLAQGFHLIPGQLDLVPGRGHVGIRMVRLGIWEQRLAI